MLHSLIGSFWYGHGSTRVRRTSSVPVAHARSRVLFETFSSDSLRSPLLVHDHRHAADCVRGFRQYHLQSRIRVSRWWGALRVLSLRQPLSHTHQNWTVLFMPVTLGTIVMRWRRRPRKRSITLTTGSSRPSTSCPVVSATSLSGCPVSARTSAPS